MRKLPIEDAIGKPLANDMTQIIPGKIKGPAFKRGHILREEDIPLLKDMGKAHVYVLDPDKGYIHEDDAAVALSDAYGGEEFERVGPSEGRINLKAGFHGLLKINLDLLTFINGSGEIICSTVHQHTVCPEGMTVAATRIIPVAMDENEFQKVLDKVKSEGPLLKLLPFVRKRIGVAVTGEEVYSGRIPDSSMEILTPKVKALGGEIVAHAICPDDAGVISETISKMVRVDDCDLIITTGGLSVDPDDVTLDGIGRSGAEIVSYGSPILPGAMFACAYLDGVPILGVPAAVFYFKATVLDIFLPRAMADDPISRADVVVLGHGGLCLNCKVCTYPVCPFGKGA
ncbi:MAG: molybdopterin-binding protein [Deltaproteobacteria bacterium]|nr:molybdopterin-binding protein [Deltaproteobacteria bacterium]